MRSAPMSDTKSRRLIAASFLVGAIWVALASCAPTICQDTPREAFLTIGSTSACHA